MLIKKSACQITVFCFFRQQSLEPVLEQDNPVGLPKCHDKSHRFLIRSDQNAEHILLNQAHADNTASRVHRTSAD